MKLARDFILVCGSRAHPLTKPSDGCQCTIERRMSHLACVMSKSVRAMVCNFGVSLALCMKFQWQCLSSQFCVLNEPSFRIDACACPMDSDTFLPSCCSHVSVLLSLPLQFPCLPMWFHSHVNSCGDLDDGLSIQHRLEKCESRELQHNGGDHVAWARTRRGASFAAACRSSRRPTTSTGRMARKEDGRGWCR